MFKRLLSAILVCAACASALMARADAPLIDQAMEDYAHARYVTAEAGFRAAAEQGDVRAQELLGFMYAFGPNLYPGIPHDRHAAAVWFGRAARGGSESAQYMYCALTRHAVTYRLHSAPCSVVNKQGTEQLGRK